MPSNGRVTSVTELSLVIVFQLGVCIFLLAQIVDATRGFGTLPGLVGYLIGGGTATGALLTGLVRRKLGSKAPDTRRSGIVRLAEKSSPTDFRDAAVSIVVRGGAAFAGRGLRVVIDARRVRPAVELQV